MFVTRLISVFGAFLALCLYACSAVASGQYLDQNGQLWEWGNNAYAQDGLHPKLPIMVDIPAPVLSAAQGMRHSVAVDDTGSVWVWGDNSAGQLGSGDFRSSAQPLRLALQAVVAVAAGAWHTVALDKDGHVWAWGSNTLGQLGDGKPGKFSVSAQPKKIENLDKVVAVRSGDFHVLVLRVDGTVWSWGGNQDEPDGKRFLHDRPIQVAGLEKMLTIKAGGNASQAVGVDGKAWVWGRLAGANEAWQTPHLLETAVPEQGAAAYRISGHVVANHRAIAGVTMSIAGEQCGNTDSKGYYHCLLPSGFAGVLRAHKEGYVFAAANISPIDKPTGRNIQGNVIRLVARHVEPKHGQRLQPEKNQHVSAPVAPLVRDTPERAKEATKPPVAPDPRIASEPRAATAATPTFMKDEAQAIHISGAVHLSGMGAKGQAVSGVGLAGDGAQCGKTNDHGEYICQVAAGWTGQIVATKRGYKFSPNTVSFKDVRNDRPYQDFKAVYEPD